MNFKHWLRVNSFSYSTCFYMSLLVVNTNTNYKFYSDKHKLSFIFLYFYLCNYPDHETVWPKTVKRIDGNINMEDVLNYDRCIGLFDRPFEFDFPQTIKKGIACKRQIICVWLGINLYKCKLEMLRICFLSYISTLSYFFNRLVNKSGITFNM